MLANFNLKVPEYRTTTAMPMSSPLGLTVAQDAQQQLGLPPKIHRVAEVPPGLPTPFGPMGDMQTATSLAGPGGNLTPQHNLLSTVQYKSAGSTGDANWPVPSIFKENVAHGLAGKHVLTVKHFSRDQMHHLFNVAHAMQAAVQKGRTLKVLEVKLGTL